MSHDKKPKREHEHASLPDPAPERAAAPGKRPRTMGLAPRQARGTVQQKPAPAAETARTARAERTAQSLAAAMRPDLHAPPVQRRGDDEGTAQAASLPASGSGQPMPEAVQSKMERSLGTDFSAVRIHQGAQAQSLGAQAYAQGTDIHFAPGQYSPHSQRGQELLGHELTHVVQQSRGRVTARAQAKGVAINDDPALEHEADELGRKAAAGEDASAAQGRTVAQSTTPVVQGTGIKFVRRGVEYDMGEEIDRREREEDDELEQAKARFLEKYPQATILLQGISSSMAASEKLLRLVRNFKQLGFTYTMRFQATEDKILATGSGSGDCHTLALVMEKVATDCLLVPGISVESMGNFIAGPGRTIDPNKAPNGPDNQIWLFENHFWISGPGGEYDPLFGDRVDKSTWKSQTAETVLHGKPYYIDKEVYGDVEIFGPFLGSGPPRYTIGWEENAWKAHERYIDEQQSSSKKKEEITREDPTPLVGGSPESSQESSDVEEDPREEIRGMLKEVEGFPGDKIEKTIELVLLKAGPEPSMSDTLKCLKLFCDGNPFMGFTYKGDSDWDTWANG